MIIEMELNIPPKFFESAKEENDFESVSERIAKQFITSILNVLISPYAFTKVKEVVKMIL